MASTVVQVRVDNDIKNEAAAIYENLGLDLQTAIRIFLKRSIAVNGIPFSMTLPSADYKAERALRAMQEMSEAARKSGVADLSLDEINAEIAAARSESDGGRR